MNTITADLLPLAVDITTLNVLRDNPRRGDVEAVRKSYEQFGQRKPIVARRGDRVVLAGNHQLLAARELGWPEIAVVWVDDDDATANAFVLADNRTGDLGTYDDELLAVLLTSIAEDSTLLAATGYTEDYLHDLQAFIAVMDSARTFDPMAAELADDRINITDDGRVTVSVILLPEHRPKLYSILKDLEWIIDARNAVDRG